MGIIERNIGNLHDQDTGLLVGYRNPVTGKQEDLNAPALQALVSGDVMRIPLAAYGAAGDTTTPISEVNGALVTASFGLPDRLRIPANTVIPGRSWIAFSVSLKKIGAANPFFRITLGPSGATSESVVYSSQITNSGQTPIVFIANGNISITANGAYCTHRTYRGAVGGDDGERATAATIDWSVDNYLTLQIFNSATGTNHQLTHFSATLYAKEAAKLNETVAAPVFVGPEFFGINSQDWPNTGSAPTLAAKSIASYDNKRTHWGRWHTALNTVSWTDTDAFVAGAKAAGFTEGTFVWYGCPTFLAPAGQQGTAGPYGLLGEGAAPTDFAQMEWAIGQFCARNSSTWGGFFTRVQIWNEVESGSFSGTASNTSFFWGSAARLVDLLWSAYSTFKANDPSLTILSPGTTSATNLLLWCNTLGTLSSKYGKQCFDDVAVHPYGAVPNPYYSGFGDLFSRAGSGIIDIKRTLAAVGRLDAGLHITEFGFHPGYLPDMITAFAALSAPLRKTYMMRTLMAAIRSGVKSLDLFSVGNAVGYCGNLTTDTTGVIAGFNEVVANTYGKTVVSGGWYSDGRERLTFSDGSVYEV